MPESSGKTSSDLSSIRTRKLWLASVQPLRMRPFLGAAALGATSASVGCESKPQRMQRMTSSGMRLVQFGDFFVAPSLRVRLKHVTLAGQRLQQR